MPDCHQDEEAAAEEEGADQMYESLCTWLLHEDADLHRGLEQTKITVDEIMAPYRAQGHVACAQRVWCKFCRRYA